METKVLAIEHQHLAETFAAEYQYLLDRYAQSLTKFDSQALFERSKERVGNLAAATREAEITRMTVYNWEKSTDDVKTKTKRKILAANLEADYFGTIEFLTRKTARERNEILERYINARLDRISKISDPEEFKTETSNLVKYLKANSGALLDIRSMHMDEVISAINKKASSLGVEGITQGVEFISSRILSYKFLRLLEVICMKTMYKEEIADRLNLPVDFVNEACTVAKYINPVGFAQENMLHRLSEGPQVFGIIQEDISHDLPFGKGVFARKY
jgi:vacuolar-type H+-ATPase subunit E/Vma4